MRENGAGVARASSGTARSPSEWDALILGGGPAGSTAAAVLAAKGRRVLVVERERFPYYKVGESLLPYCYFPLERIGMIEKLRSSSFVKKYSVQFASMDGRISAPFYFFQHFDHPAAQTWQVLRCEFDQMMLDNAVGKGARLMKGATAKRLLLNGCKCEGLLIEKDGETFPVRAPMTIDCGGRHGFAATQMGWIIPDPHLNKVAIWTYYRGAKRDQGYDEGATTVAYLPGKGWFWYIPLPDDVAGVGVVAERDYLYREGKDLEAILDREIQANSWIAEHLATGRRCEPVRVTAEYSYRSRYCAGDGLVLAGDAFTFLDSSLFLRCAAGFARRGASRSCGRRRPQRGRRERGSLRRLRRGRLSGSRSDAQAGLRVLRGNVQFREAAEAASGPAGRSDGLLDRQPVQGLPSAFLGGRRVREGAGAAAVWRRANGSDGGNGCGSTRRDRIAPIQASRRSPTAPAR